MLQKRQFSLMKISQKCPNAKGANAKYILGKNEKVSDITKYEDLFKGDLEEQVYISRLLKGNLRRLKAKTTM